MKQREPLKLEHLEVTSAKIDSDGDVKIDVAGSPVYIHPEDMDRLAAWWTGAPAKPVTWRDLTVSPGADGSVTIKLQP